MGKQKTIIVTGSSGLIGSQCVRFFAGKGFNVIGIDNDMRKYFFGEEASTAKMKDVLEDEYNNFTSYNIDIRDYEKLKRIFVDNKEIDLVIHTAAQPSHDWAAKEPITDFTINALGTMNLLELFRQYCPEASFIFTSTNKVFGDRPNYLNLQELETRYEYYKNGVVGAIDETMSIDNTLHSVFGASKVAADVMVQEYGRYFNLNTVCFRGGCLTGPNHQGTELHGFLSYLIKCIVHDKPYTIYGYKGKQVRDNIHSYDLVNAFWHYYQNPRKGEVYNIGGGRDNCISMIEAIKKVNDYLNVEWGKYTISKDNRIGDHIWYVTDLTKFKSHYKDWDIEYSLNEIIEDIIEHEIKIKNKLR